jgi:hypothetical protein
MREDPQWRGKGVSTTAMTGQAPAKTESTGYFFSGALSCRTHLMTLFWKLQWQEVAMQL